MRTFTLQELAMAITGIGSIYVSTLEDFEPMLLVCLLGGVCLSATFATSSRTPRVLLAGASVSVLFAGIHIWFAMGNVMYKHSGMYYLTPKLGGSHPEPTMLLAVLSLSWISGMIVSWTIQGLRQLSKPTTSQTNK